MGAVDEDSFERHGLATEDVHVGCFVLPFEVVEQSHDQGHSLDGSIKFLFAKCVEEGEDEDGSEVFDVEDVFPPDLSSQIFEAEDVAGDLDELQVFIVVGEDDLVVTFFVGEFLLEEGYFGLCFQLLLDPPDGLHFVGSEGDLSVFVLDGEVDRHIYQLSIKTTTYKINYKPLKLFPQRILSRLVMEQDRKPDLFDVTKLSEASRQRYRVLIHLSRAISVWSAPLRNCPPGSRTTSPTSWLWTG